MSNAFFYRYISSLLMITCLLIPLSNGFAKSISLYDQPKEGKPIGTLDSEVGVISIFTPKGSSWVKVADPRNGNVGWVKSADLSDAKISMNLINASENKQHYQRVQLGQPSAQMMQLMQQQHRDLQQMMQNFFNEANQDLFGLSSWSNAAPIMPVFILPVKEVSTSNVVAKK